MSDYWTWHGNPEGSLEEARRRVAVCAEKNDVALYFGDLDLDRLPEGISTLTQLTELRMLGGRIADFAPLAPLSNMELLQIGSRNCPFPGLDFMSGWSKLQTLEIMTPCSAIDLKPAAACTALKRLHISSKRTDLLNLEVLTAFEAIEQLSLTGAQSERFDVIGERARLKFVQLCKTNLTGLTGFENLHQLEHLYITEASVSDLSPLAGLAKLEQLTLSDMPVSDLSSLASMPLLRRLDVSNTRVSDLSPLVRLAECQREFHEMKRREDPSRYRSDLEALKMDKSNVTDISPLAHLE
jgi:Leucine-rich repeat (LRR) protein